MNGRCRSIDGLSPHLDRSEDTGRSPRSTAATIMRSNDISLLFLHRIPHCPVCGSEISARRRNRILKHVLLCGHNASSHAGLSRAQSESKGSGKACPQGFAKRMTGHQIAEDDFALDKRLTTPLKIIVDRCGQTGHRKETGSSIETPRAWPRAGAYRVVDAKSASIAKKLACANAQSVPTGRRSFSFNSPYGLRKMLGIGNTWRSSRQDHRGAGQRY